ETLPFESERQYMATLHGGSDGRRTAYIKGSTEAIVARCSKQRMPDGSDVPIDKDAIHARTEDLAARGLRVLALATKELEPGKESIDHSDIERDFVLAGLQGIIDPPREEAKKAIEICKRAGI